MSKYNHIKSIPIDSVPKKELKLAIKEWAEGDESLEKLLWICYQRGIKTSGCHAGSGPFIQFNYQENLDVFNGLLEVTENTPGSQILISVDGGNPFSGPEWDIATISIGIDTSYQDEADSYFDSLIQSFGKNDSNDLMHPLLRLLKFFFDLESGLLFRFRHNLDHSFVFSIESRPVSDTRFQYYHSLFTKIGLEEECYHGRYEWILRDHDLYSILNRMNSIADAIINEYSLDAETNENEMMDFIILARFKKRHLSSKEFEKWLKEQRF